MRYWDGLLDDVVDKVVVETAWGPPIEVPLKSEGPSTSSAAGKLLRPKVTVYVKGASPIKIAPYGEPGPTKWPWVQLGLGVGLLFFLVGAGTTVRRFAK